MTEINQNTVGTDRTETAPTKATYVAPSLLHIGALNEKTETNKNNQGDGFSSAS